MKPLLNWIYGVGFAIFLIEVLYHPRMWTSTDGWRYFVVKDRYIRLWKIK